MKKRAQIHLSSDREKMTAMAATTVSCETRHEKVSIQVTPPIAGHSQCLNQDENIITALTEKGRAV